MNTMFEKTFCNVPWFECHIYYNGDFGICSHEWHKPNGDDCGSVVKSKYNIENMSITEWFNSDLMRSNRKSFLTTNCKLSMCEKCYRIEDSSGHGNRHRHLQNSAIFPTVDFIESYRQSPHYNSFEMSREDGYTNTLPMYIHVDLGNYCNLACKMCYAPASSTIAKQEVLWGIEDSKKYIGTDWTRDPLVWQRFLEDIATMPTRSKIHFMGGETLQTKRFEQFIDYMSKHNRYDLWLSFVTNGMPYNQNLLDKLSRFHNVDIEISIETADAVNEYVRQGTDNSVVFANIKRYQEWTQQNNFQMCIRSVPNSLTIGTYYTLLQYCLDNNLLIQSNFIREPEYLVIRHLPENVKQQYLGVYKDFVKHNSLDTEQQINDYNSYNKQQVDRVIAWHTHQAIVLLEQKCTAQSEQHFQNMLDHCKRWDNVYNFDIQTFYPEFSHVV